MSCVLHHFPINLSLSRPDPDRNLFINPKPNLRTKDWTFSPHEQLSATILHSITLSTKARDPNLGSCLHAQITKLGITTDVLINNALLSMYAKFGLTHNAHQVFDQMPLRTVASWTSLIWAYCQEEKEHHAISLYQEMLENLQPNAHTLAVLMKACAKQGNLELAQVIHCSAVKYGLISDGFLMNCLIDAYGKSGSAESAEIVLDMLSSRDVVSWTSAISGYVWNGRADKAIQLFFRMQEDDVQPNEVTILSVLHACSCINQTCLFQCMHGLVVKSTDWSRNSLVMNSLVEMYIVNGFFHEGVKILCGFCFESFNGESNFLCIETMAKLIQGCSLKVGEEIHGYLVKNGFLPCNIIDNSLLAMYSRNDRYDSVNRLFEIMRFKDLITWNTMISCLVKNKQPENALKLLSRIQSSPDFITMISSLQACSSLASSRLGQVIHGYIIRTGMINDIVVQNSLIDMYAKSGNLCLSERVFIEMNSKDIGSWNTMIMSYGINSDGISALSLFNHLMKTHQPNEITFINVLAACGHTGLITEGLDIFDRMEIEPRMEHYACMVDLLGRAGKVEEAKEFIANMPMSPGRDVWGALLGACLLFNNVEVAEKAVRHLGLMEPNGNYWKVAMANIYAGNGRWEDAAKMRNELKKKGGDEGHGRKEEGWSCLEIRGEMVRFVAADLNHQQSHEIYKVLNGIHSHIREAV